VLRHEVRVQCRELLRPDGFVAVRHDRGIAMVNSSISPRRSSGAASRLGSSRSNAMWPCSPAPSRRSM
jgi:hypothetical protein